MMLLIEPETARGVWVFCAYFTQSPLPLLSPPPPLPSPLPSPFLSSPPLLSLPLPSPPLPSPLPLPLPQAKRVQHLCLPTPLWRSWSSPSLGLRLPSLPEHLSRAPSQEGKRMAVMMLSISRSTVDCNCAPVLYLAKTFMVETEYDYNLLCYVKSSTSQLTCNAIAMSL